MHRAPEPSRPSQIRRPWRATLRTVLVATLGVMPLLPEISRAAGIATVPAVVSTLAVVAAVQRVLTLPSVDKWLDTWAAPLAADPPRKDHPYDPR